MGSDVFLADDKGFVTACSQCGEKVRIPFKHAHRQGKCPECAQQIKPIGEPVEIPGMHVFDAVIRSSSVPLLIDFWASWCAPCRALSPELITLAHDECGRLIVGKVDTEKQADLAIRYQVRSIPTLVAFSEGREVDRFTGVRPAASIASFLREREVI